ncbi:MAG: aminodeoxychorismate/anthranilate synthase component II [Cardiobacteriaceae bacterium]|nr:aminodeoxychorismate/anthranilate synthase component II [Cardiobacteriaceae bacterium]
MLLMIDNYDSFTFNLVQYFAQLGQEVVVYRNDEITLERIAELAPQAIVISPGPCSPKEAGISMDVIKRFAGKTPILGVCLGHQCLGEAFGGEVVRAPIPKHGKLSEVYHYNKGVFEGLPNPVNVMRYHSLLVDEASLPEDFEITAYAEENSKRLIMGMRHKTWLLEGVQFHPESFLTEQGFSMLDNFLKAAGLRV